MSTRSAFCQFAVHDRCTGTAAGEPCGCTCHQPAQQDPAQLLRERVVLLLDELVPELRREDTPKVEEIADQVIALVRAASPCP